MTNWQS